MERAKDNVFIKIAKYLFPWKGDKPAEIIRKIIFLCAVIVLIVTAVIFISQKQNSKYEQKVKNEIIDLYYGGGVTIDTKVKEELQHKYPEVQERFLPLLADEKNIYADQITGWLTINGYGGEEPLVDEIVMKGTDNDYYLRHNVRGTWVRSGSLFADYRNKITPEETSGNIVIYGHNMTQADPTIDHFGILCKYFNYDKNQADKSDITFYKQHPTLTFSTLYDTNEYKIFGAIMVNTETVAGDVFRYHNIHNFANKSEFDEFVAGILDRSCFINPDVDLRYGDELLTLSTCIFGYGDAARSRFVVFARKTRDGESPEVETNRAMANPSPLFYDLYYRMFGGSWEGRQWPTDIIWGYEEKKDPVAAS